MRSKGDEHNMGGLEACHCTLKHMVRNLKLKDNICAV